MEALCGHAWSTTDVGMQTARGLWVLAFAVRALVGEVRDPAKWAGACLRLPKLVNDLFVVFRWVGYVFVAFQLTHLTLAPYLPAAIQNCKRWRGGGDGGSGGGGLHPSPPRATPEEDAAWLAFTRLVAGASLCNRVMHPHQGVVTRGKRKGWGLVHSECMLVTFSELGEGGGAHLAGLVGNVEDAVLRAMDGAWVPWRGVRVVVSVSQAVKCVWSSREVAAVATAAFWAQLHVTSAKPGGVMHGATPTAPWTTLGFLGCVAAGDVGVSPALVDPGDVSMVVWAMVASQAGVKFSTLMQGVAYLRGHPRARTRAARMWRFLVDLVLWCGGWDAVWLYTHGVEGGPTIMDLVCALGKVALGVPNPELHQRLAVALAAHGVSVLEDAACVYTAVFKRGPTSEVLPSKDPARCTRDVVGCVSHLGSGSGSGSGATRVCHTALVGCGAGSRGLPWGPCVLEPGAPVVGAGTFAVSGTRESVRTIVGLVTTLALFKNGCRATDALTRAREIVVAGSVIDSGAGVKVDSEAWAQAQAQARDLALAPDGVWSPSHPLLPTLARALLTAPPPVGVPGIPLEWMGDQEAYCVATGQFAVGCTTDFPVVGVAADQWVPVTTVPYREPTDSTPLQSTGACPPFTSCSPDFMATVTKELNNITQALFGDAV